MWGRGKRAAQADARLRALVEAHGWAVVRVPADAEGPAFAYTVGLLDGPGHPEIAASGLPDDPLYDTVAAAADHVLDGGRLIPGESTDAVLVGYACAVRTADPAGYGEWFGAGLRYYGDRPFRAVQVFWPDRDGRFPWDDGYDAPPQARMDRPPTGGGG